MSLGQRKALLAGGFVFAVSSLLSVAVTKVTNRQISVQAARRDYETGVINRATNLYITKQYTAAIPVLLQWIDLQDPDYPSWIPRQMLARCYFRTSNLNKATEQLQVLFHQKEADAWDRILYARILIARHQQTAADQQLTMACRVSAEKPYSNQVHLEIARCAALLKAKGSDSDSGYSDHDNE